MNFEQLNQKIQPLLHPDIKCFVTKNKSSDKSTVCIEYYTLHTRSGMIGGVEEGILHIGNTLYLQDKKKSFIQILDENEKLICNQELDIFIKKQPEIRVSEKYDVLLDILPEATGSGFWYSISSKSPFQMPAMGKVTSNSLEKPIQETSKEILIRICFKLANHHKVLDIYQISYLIHINIHHIDFGNNTWGIINDEFEVNKR